MCQGHRFAGANAKVKESIVTQIHARVKERVYGKGGDPKVMQCCGKRRPCSGADIKAKRRSLNARTDSGQGTLGGKGVGADLAPANVIPGGWSAGAA